MQQNIDKKVLTFEIIAFLLSAENSHYYEQSTCHRQSMYKQTVLRVHI